MSIDVKEVATLARLKLTEEWEPKVEEQLKQVMSYFQQLQAVDTKLVEPMVTPVEIDMMMREDKVIVTPDLEEVLEQAPEKMGRLYKVPPVV